jgi:hypothetical protein
VGETAAQIEQQIDEQRDQLESHVQHLRSQLRSLVDWRQQVERHPWKAAATVFLATYWMGKVFGRAYRRL